MSGAPAFQFYPKQWLGDDKILLMDWDARGMHMHLICIAWQQDPPCTLPDDDELWRRWCGNPRAERWRKIKHQIQNAYQLRDGRWVQDGLLRQYEKQRQYAQSRREAAEARWGKQDAYASRTQSVRNALPLQSSSSIKNKTDAALSSGSLTAFETFYQAYPRKKNRGDAEKAWAALKPDDQLVRLMLTAVGKAKGTPEWKEEHGKYIPYPASWLRAKRWLDEMPTVPKERIPL